MHQLDFLIIGVQKAATSAIDDYLRQHPEITLGKQKELHFFDSEKYFQNKEVDYSPLFYQFDIEPNKIIGECTPIYIYWNSCCERIWQHNKNIKLIVILRNPIERAYSHWNMEFSRGKESLSFFEAILEEEKRSKETLPFQHRVYSYIDRGFYSEQLRRLLRFFNRDQILFIKYESFKKDPESQMKSIFDFLEVKKIKIDINKTYVNKGAYSSKILNDEFNYLHSVFINDIREVERILDWNCDDWLVNNSMKK